MKDVVDTYLVGEFRARFTGRKTKGRTWDEVLFEFEPEQPEVRNAILQEGISPTQFNSEKLWEWDQLRDVVIEFKEKVNAPHTLFKEHLLGAVLRNIEIRDVVVDGKKSHGMLYGTLYAPLFGSAPVPTPRNIARAKTGWTGFNLKREDFPQEPIPEPVPKLEVAKKPAVPLKEKVKASQTGATEPERRSRVGFFLLLLIMLLFSGLFALAFYSLEMPKMATAVSVVSLLAMLGTVFQKSRTWVAVTFFILLFVGYISLLIYILAASLQP